MSKVISLLTRHTSLFIIAVAIFAAILPDAFAWVQGTKQTVILGIIMLGMGLTLTTADIRALAARPIHIIIGVLAQFSIMPLVAYFLSQQWGLSQPLAIGIILVGCCPGGVSSNIMSFLCKGDVAFSVGMTTCTTLLAPVITPFMMQMLAGERIAFDAFGMFVNILVVTILPISAGLIANHCLSANVTYQRIRSAMPAVAVIGLALIVGGVIRVALPHIAGQGISLLALTMGVVFCHNTLGYAVGYLIARIVGFDVARRRTLSIEVGMQNAGLATVLASNFFAAACPLSVLPCAISCAWHSISGTILANLFAMMDKPKPSDQCTQPD